MAKDVMRMTLEGSKNFGDKRVNVRITSYRGGLLHVEHNVGPLSTFHDSINASIFVAAYWVLGVVRQHLQSSPSAYFRMDTTDGASNVLMMQKCLNDLEEQVELLRLQKRYNGAEEFFGRRWTFSRSTRPRLLTIAFRPNPLKERLIMSPCIVGMSPMIAVDAVRVAWAGDSFAAYVKNHLRFLGLNFKTFEVLVDKNYRVNMVDLDLASLAQRILAAEVGHVANELVVSARLHGGSA
eukprot:TRINITY_DN33001_c0_g1_i1.p1 TRINITY_DN33001_c0_g1~~TRINITY_DN33001_c0_g1_i1.p1  ORF type:complete len:238 (-),score=57.99 TRINITY_DN33001_c0_g1_i1:121-834(-)